MTTTSVTEQAIAVMEDFRTRIRAIGNSSPAVEEFIDQMNALITVYRSPKTAMEALFAALAEMRPADPAVVEVIGGAA
ncbi:hypothetical protein ABT167_27535 [Streptomyces sp. NPDC001792]|uniref:hypothetical protein n=1 Tax=Streptomyces sp. NPDC001792 TaxID=3154524 RepID=UPI00332C2637